MNAEIHQLKPRAAVNWMCSVCGIDAGCNCGAPLMSKAQRAAEAIAANPRKSDRAIADEIGVSRETVRKERNSTDNQLSVNDEPRIGLDGKERRMPTRRAVEDEEEIEFSQKELSSRDRGSFLLRAQEAKNFAFYKGKVDVKLLEFARGTAGAWCDLVKTLEKQI